MRWAQLILAVIALLMLSDFVLRGLALAFEPDKTDFSEVYVGAWLWRHGQDPYNSNAATIAQAQLVGPSAQIAPIYPISTFALLAPFTFLPYGWANLIWLLLALGGVGATIFLLFRIHKPELGRFAMMALATFLLAFDPLHQAYHLGNVVLLVFPLALGAIVLGEHGQDWWAGVILGTCVALKPQIGVWILLHYLLQRRQRIFYGALAALGAVAGILLLRPVPLLPTLSDYRANLHYWFRPRTALRFCRRSLGVPREHPSSNCLSFGAQCARRKPDCTRTVYRWTGSLANSAVAEPVSHTRPAGDLESARAELCLALPQRVGCHDSDPGPVQGHSRGTRAVDPPPDFDLCRFSPAHAARTLCLNATHPAP